MSTTIAVNHSAVEYGLSKMNWVKVGSSYIFSANPGAYLKIKFTGTSFNAVVDMTALNATGAGSSAFPVLKWYLDGVAQTAYQLQSSDSSIPLATGLADTTHTLELHIIGTDESGNTDRWNQVMGVKITSFTVDNSRTVSNASLRSGGLLAGFGDSITEAAESLGAATNPPYYTQVEDATQSYLALLASRFNMEYSMIAFAGQRLAGGVNVSQVPGLLSTYNLIQAGVSRSFEPNISAVLINIGTNGSVTPADYKTLLENLRSAVGSIAALNAVIPFGQYNVSDLATGYASYVSAHPTDTAIVKIDEGSAGATIVTNNSSGGGVHPTAAGHALLEADLCPSFRYGVYFPSLPSFLTGNSVVGFM